MAENRARHAFGMLENIDEALSVGKIDSYDILFVKDTNGKPYVGWIDKDGNKVICDDSAKFEELFDLVANKADILHVQALEGEIANKVDASEVDTKVEQAVGDRMAGVEDLVDQKVEEKIAEINSACEIVEF